MSDDPSNYDERCDLADRALAALHQLRVDFGGERIYAELLGRLTWLAPDALLTAIDEQRASIEREGMTP